MWNISQAGMLTSEVIFGSGNSNEFFTVTQENGIEIGLRAKVRYPSPQNSDQSNSLGYALNEGDYYFSSPSETVTIYVFGFPVGTTERASWNLDWSVNTDYLGSSGDVIDDYSYELSFMFDPESGGSSIFNAFDPMYPGNDNEFGDNMTPNGGGVTGNVGDIYNVAQNSTNVSFFGVLPGLDETQNGIYTIDFSVRDNTNTVVASNQILVYAGVEPPAAVPEPTSLAIFGIGSLGLIGNSLRKRLKQKRASSQA